MPAFYHHVGAEGAKDDFPKTVYRDLPVASVLSHIPLTSPEAVSLCSSIEASFPDGYCNAWGVPAGAKQVIGHLAERDVVFLIQSLRFVDPGLVCIATVDAYRPIQLPDLSEYLWGSLKFPYIFLFRTVKADVSWQDFRDLLGYTSNYDPRGKFLSIAAERLAPLGGVEGLLAKVAMIQRAYPLAASPAASYPSPIGDPIGPIVSAMERASLSSEPTLLDEQARKASIAERAVRDPAFARTVLKQYEYRCAVCGSGVRAASGTYELEAAHICPVTKSGPDDIRNGLALCRLHHWAFDCGMWSIGKGNTVEVAAGLPDSPGLERIREFHGHKLRDTPPHLKPHVLFINRHRISHGLNPLEP